MQYKIQVFTHGQKGLIFLTDEAVILTVLHLHIINLNAFVFPLATEFAFVWQDIFLYFSAAMTSVARKKNKGSLNTS